MPSPQPNLCTQGTLPFRALALRYGADTVFTEEVIDRRIVNAVRTENRVLETVDYVESRGKKPPAVPFQTCALERDRLVYQIGTGNAVYALKAAQVRHSPVRCCMLRVACGESVGRTLVAQKVSYYRDDANGSTKFYHGYRHTWITLSLHSSCF